MNFDIRAEVRGFIVNADCKTRTNLFPFNLPRFDEEPPEGIQGYFGSRATIDPHLAVAMELPSHVPAAGEHYLKTPESTVILRTLREALGQLPADGFNMVLFGHLQGSRTDLDYALFGAPVATIFRSHATKESWVEWSRAGTAAFTESGRGIYSRLSAVLWMRLLHLGGDGLVRAYELYPNPLAKQPLPESVGEALRAVMASWTTENEIG